MCLLGVCCDIATLAQRVGGQLCYVPADCFINVLLPIAEHVFGVPVTTIDDAAKLRATVKSDTYNTFEQSVLQYGVNCFDQRMQVRVCVRACVVY